MKFKAGEIPYKSVIEAFLFKQKTWAETTLSIIGEALGGSIDAKISISNISNLNIVYAFIKGNIEVKLKFKGIVKGDGERTAVCVELNYIQCRNENKFNFMNGFFDTIE